MVSDENDITLSGRPRLAGFARVQHDAVRDRWVLQAPERVLVLDEISKEIVDHCTGTATVDAIVTALCAEYDAPRDVIEHDVLGVLRLLAEKTFVVIEDGDERP